MNRQWRSVPAEKSAQDRADRHGMFALLLMSALCHKGTHAPQQLTTPPLQEIANFRQQLTWGLLHQAITEASPESETDWKDESEIAIGNRGWRGWQWRGTCEQG